MNIQHMMKQAQKMQQKMEEVQKQLSAKSYEGTSGGGMVTVTLNGKSEMLKVKIDPSLFASQDVEMLEDLVVAATNQAQKNVNEDSSSAMSGIMGGMGLPAGLKLPF